MLNVPLPVPSLHSAVNTIVSQIEGAALRKVCQQWKHSQKLLCDYMKKCNRLILFCKNGKYLCIGKLNRSIQHKVTRIRTLRTKKRRLEEQLKKGDKR